MKYHLALGSSLDLEGINREALLGKRPGHIMWDLSQAVAASVHMPGREQILPIDRLRAKLISLPEHWALARKLSSELHEEDVVYCNGEDIGLPLAILCGAKPNRPKLIIFFHAANRPRVRAALTLFRLEEKIDVFVSNTEPQFNYLRKTVRVPESRLHYLAEQTDTRFFCPGPVSPDKARPIIASAGLELRDYKILAAATADLNVDVKISGFSRDAVPLAKSFPKTLPANMSRRYYEWAELVQLYRDADLVVVSLFQGDASSGITTLMEAMACGRPVIATQTNGLADYLQTPGTVIPIAPGDSNGLKAAIAYVFAHPEEAEAQAKRAYQMISEHHNSQRYVEKLVSLLKSVR
ncbi:MAG: glycosyltransferase family 4 protein [Stenomitos rutilans HA7619-LM2]|jgi:glycosyltransferase involved in cell wall biosynthesis|nr:glycosyltransferase family 4 protein [Stenomitos rutilans HA7619-LM2]